MEDEFEVVWRAYPRRIARLAALKAYRKARTTATAEDILAGVEQYRRNKPAYADWCYPATFLNQGRWMDEPDHPSRQGWACTHQPTCESQWRCYQLSQIDAFKRETVGH